MLYIFCFLYVLRMRLFKASFLQNIVFCEHPVGQGRPLGAGAAGIAVLGLSRGAGAASKKDEIKEPACGSLGSGGGRRNPKDP